jgi:hypothetical protein
LAINEAADTNVAANTATKPATVAKMESENAPQSPTRLPKTTKKEASKGLRKSNRKKQAAAGKPGKPIKNVNSLMRENVRNSQCGKWG